MFGFLPGPCGCSSRDDRSVWRSHFCGLCNTLRARYGLWSRWLINRDSTFLALTGSALAVEEPVVTCATCCNPLGKKRPLVQGQGPVQYAAAVTICGLAVKLQDDAGDERGLRRRAAGAGAWLLRGAVRKARMDLAAGGFPVEAAARGIGAREGAEVPGVSLSAAAEPTARTYGAIFGHVAPLAGAAGALSDAGAALGRMIYTVDAFEDYESDVRRRRFNPLPGREALRREMTVEAVERDLGVFARALSAVSFRRHGALIMALAGPQLRERTMGRLGMEGPPPLPPVEGGAPPPRNTWNEPPPKERRSGCRDWSCGCCSKCGGGASRRGKSGRSRRNCCDGCHYCDCGGCDCPDADCGGCDGCGCDC